MQLLADCRAAFGDRSRLSTAELLAELQRMEATQLPSERLTGRAVALVLRRFEIRPKNLRLGGAVVKGYERRDFEDAWRRYL